MDSEFGKTMAPIEVVIPDWAYNGIAGDEINELKVRAHFPQAGFVAIPCTLKQAEAVIEAVRGMAHSIATL